VQALTSPRTTIRLAVVAAPKPQDVMLTREQFEASLRQAAPGARIVYHRGYLALDRARGSSKLSEMSRRELAAVATLAMELAVRGQLHLLQRRHEDGDYSYLAVVASRCMFAAQHPTPAAR
jgi:hypothetical protein